MSAAARAQKGSPQGPGDLTGYIRFSIQQGLSEGAVRRTLIESGVSEERVAEAFRKLFSVEEIPPMEQEEPAAPAQAQAAPAEAELPEIEVEDAPEPGGLATALRGKALERALMAEPARPSHLVSGAPVGRSLVMEFNHKVELQPPPGRIQRVAIKEPGTISLLIRKRGLRKKSRKKKDGKRGNGFLTTATLLLGLGACAMIWSGLNPMKVAKQAEQVVRQAAKQGSFMPEQSKAPRKLIHQGVHQGVQRTR